MEKKGGGGYYVEGEVEKELFFLFLRISGSDENKKPLDLLQADDRVHPTPPQPLLRQNN